MISEDGYKLCIGEHLGGDGRGLFQITIPAFRMEILRKTTKLLNIIQFRAKFRVGYRSSFCGFLAGLLTAEFWDSTTYTERSVKVKVKVKVKLSLCFNWYHAMKAY
jgi:hypothetical protein